MTVLLMVVLSAILLVGIGSFYSRFLARSFGETKGRPTPAILKNDGRDYVPTPTPVVFGHHFASIAGAGPIVGPVLAICYGWGPAILWVVLGGLFIGGVHDYLAAFMSTREGGQSIATIARRMLGRGPFIALMLFLVLMLGLVCATFLNLSATALTSTLSWSVLNLPEGQSLFRTLGEGAARQVVVGGIASTSVIVITACAPLLGWLYLKKKVSVWKCSLLAIVVCAVSITIGLFYPVALQDHVSIFGWQTNGTDIWKLLLAFYCLLAAGVPVWIFLQSRDFINVHILYVGMGLLVVALLAASMRAGGSQASAGLPVFDADTGYKAMGLFWPAVFITVACGAVSGFHSLCAGGTTSKQLKSEPATRHIGYWAMLLESFLAVCVISVMVLGLTKSDYLAQVYPKLLALPGKTSNPILGFALAVGVVGHQAFGISKAIGVLAGMILLEGFLVTTLDTAVRLMRYLLEEVWRELFHRYDVFAVATDDAAAQAQVETPVGTGGIPATTVVNGAPAPPRPLATHGLLRGVLQFLRYYWVNSGLAVVITLWFAFSAGILKLWSLFATSNQLLAAFALSLGAIWLLRRGRRTWYVVGPALFMLATTIASLFNLVGDFLPAQVDGKSVGNPTLFIADICLIVLTAYLVATGLREIVSLYRRQPVPMAID